MFPAGLLNIHKPSGISSRRVVDQVKRLVRPAKAGHAGTLDPLASGVLVVCIGAATRLVQYIHRLPKCYRATFLLGRRSPTEDIEGDVTLLDNPPRPLPEEIRRTAAGLTGTIQQRPPAFSALKVAGRRAYELARAARPFDLQPRTVTVHRMEIVKYDYPELTLDIECGSGTYVRSLGRDLAASLGTSAVMSELVRTAVGALRIADACRLDRLGADHPACAVPGTADRLAEWLLPPARAVESLARVQLADEELLRVARGLAITRTATGTEAEYAAFDARGRLVGILQRRSDGSLGPVVNLPLDA